MNLPRLRAGFEGSGSPRWLMTTLQKDGLDAAHGFCLELCLLAEDGLRHGTLAAVAAGRADLVDADWLALARARAEGLPVTAIAPYGRILGALVGGRNLAGDGIHALPGSRLGVLSVTDKNWAILAAACADLAGFELAAEAEIETYTRRADLMAALAEGAVDAALVHWHLVPALEARGHRLLAEIPALAATLGAEACPTTFFVVHDHFARRQADLVRAFIAASSAALARLQDDGAAWAAIARDLGCDPKALHGRWRHRVADARVWSPHSRPALEALRTRLMGGSAGPLPVGTFDKRFLP